jgi:hypothetical protein
MHGISQGNGGGPPIWAVISTTLLDTIQSKGYGFSMASPITNQEISFVGYSFVDDNDIVQSDGGQPRKTTVKLQQAVDTWEGGLKITGGALGPDKSYWYLITFNWTVGGKWSYAPVSDTPATLYMKDIQNNRKVVCHIRPDQVRRNARVWIAPNGDMFAPCKSLTEKSILWADQMRTGFIRKDETWLAF